MMKKINYGFVLLLLLLAVMACKKDPLPDVNCNSPTNDLALSKELIVGCWRLSKTRYFFDSSYVVNYVLNKNSIDIRFTKDGVVECYQGGEFIDSSRYEIDIMKKYTLFPGDTTRNVLWIVNTKKMYALENLVPIRICTDSLYLFYESFRYHSGNRYFYRIE